MELGKGYRPYSEVQSGEASDRLKLGIQLPPYVNEERIGLHTQRIEKWMDLGGIKTLTIQESHDEVTKYVPQIVGINDDGTAEMAKTGVAEIVPIHTVKSVPTEETRELNEAFLSHAAHWVDTTITVNTAEVVERMEEDKVPLRSTKAWSSYLDKAVREGVSEAGTQHLVYEMEQDQYPAVVAPYSFMNLSVAHNFPSLPHFIAGNVVTGVMGNVVGRYLYYKHGGSEGYRWSALWGPQVDRAVVLDASTSIQHGVRPLNEAGEVEK